MAQMVGALRGGTRLDPRAVLQIVQPALLGLMDGAVSTLTPLFAAAQLTHSASSTFLVGFAGALGAGISMGLVEALSDDGAISGRSGPLSCGLITGGSTALGGMLHTLPFLVGDIGVGRTRLRCRRRRADRNRLHPLPFHGQPVRQDGRPGHRRRWLRLPFGDVAGTDRCGRLKAPVFEDHRMIATTLGRASLSEYTVAAARKWLTGRGHGWHRALAFAGPAVVASIAYMGPGQFRDEHSGRSKVRLQPPMGRAARQSRRDAVPGALGQARYH
jgi:hypothetical protein